MCVSVCIKHPLGLGPVFTEDDRDNLQSIKLTNVVRLRPNDLPDRSKEFSPGLLGNCH